MKAFTFLLAAVACVITCPSLAQPAKPPIVAKVDTVQVPSWVERGGVRASVKAGWAIYAGDRVFTGPEGRLGLSLIGEGKIRISGNAELAFSPSGSKESNDNAPIFDVRAGTYQLSAPIVVRADQPGTIFQLNGLATANVRGGQVVGNRDSLVQVDGLTQVTGNDRSVVTLNAPQTVVSVTPGGKVLKPIPVPGERLAQWIAEAQPLANRATLRAEGTWDVSLNSGYNLRELETMACRINKRGFPSEIYPVREPGKQVWYRVVIRRFATKGEAVQFLGTARELGSKEPWVLLPQS